MITLLIAGVVSIIAGLVLVVLLVRTIYLCKLYEQKHEEDLND